MANIEQIKRRPCVSCFDIYGNELIISRGRKNKINFTLYHDEVVEGTARKEFVDTAIKIPADSGQLSQMMRGLYEINGNSFVFSEDPIRDGKNFLFLEQNPDGSYYMTIGRDLANELNRPRSTNIELSGQKYEDLLEEAGLKTEKPPVKKFELSQ